MSFGIYVHIPYCLQKCHYCDFTTFSLDHPVNMQKYTSSLLQELDRRHSAIQRKNVTSIYFGGGTPSLLPAEHILTIVKKISSLGFEIDENAEITIEINPGTIDEKKLDLYLAAGVNRFSVGVQTFDDRLLRLCGREHSADDTRRTLKFLARHNLNYSFDLLFGLPEQTLDGLKMDVDELLSFTPPHVSTYIMNVPEAHPMNRNRAPESEQAEMFDIVQGALEENGLFRYEISNFAREGRQSLHNLIYWTDQAYWGIGISSHSYLPELGAHGTRFWNPTSSREYLTQVETLGGSQTSFIDQLPRRQVERLRTHEALTDFLHTQFRRMKGLSLGALQRKFSAETVDQVKERLNVLLKKGWITSENDEYRLTFEGLKLSNQVFLELTFLEV